MWTFSGRLFTDTVLSVYRRSPFCVHKCHFVCVLLWKLNRHFGDKLVPIETVLRSERNVAEFLQPKSRCNMIGRFRFATDLFQFTADLCVRAQVVCEDSNNNPNGPTRDPKAFCENMKANHGSKYATPYYSKCKL